MDLREIIKWFIPCFHILLMKFNKMDVRLTLLCIFLFFNFCPTFGAHVESGHLVLSPKSIDNTKNVDNLLNDTSINKFNPSEEEGIFQRNAPTYLQDTSVGRTFGRPLKKMMSALIPLIFQIGAASTWAVVAALVGVKTLFVTLVILKLLMVAGAAKAGALFASKGHHHQSHGWEQPHPHQKEIHLHIHNGGHHTPSHEEIISPSWSRQELQPKNDLAMVINPYAVGNPYAVANGPQTISTPYGNYVKID